MYLELQNVLILFGITNIMLGLDWEIPEVFCLFDSSLILFLWYVLHKLQVFVYINCKRGCLPLGRGGQKYVPVPRREGRCNSKCLPLEPKRFKVKNVLATWKFPFP